MSVGCLAVTETTVDEYTCRLVHLAAKSHRLEWPAAGCLTDASTLPEVTHVQPVLSTRAYQSRSGGVRFRSVADTSIMGATFGIPQNLRF
jgi:hypothetical protein